METLKKIVTQNIGLKVASVFVATMLWLVVVSVDDPVTSRAFTQIPVELTNSEYILSDGKVYEVLDNSDNVSITVTAKRSILDSLSRDYFKATADMTKLEGEDVPIEVKATRYSDRIENISIKNKNVKVFIENLIEKQYNIQVSTEGNLANGYVVGDITLDKNVVKVSGPESIMDRIQGAYVTVNVDGLSGKISTVEEIELRDSDGNRVSPAGLKQGLSNVNIQIELWGSKEVPLVYGYTGAPAADYGTTGEIYCNPDRMTVTGSDIALATVANITLPAYTVDITDATGDVDAAVSVANYLPEGVSLLPGDTDGTAIVHVGIARLESKYVEVPASNIAVINVPDDMTVHVGGYGEVVAVEVKGMGDTFVNVSPEQITGVIDVSKAEQSEETEGEEPELYEIPIEFAFPEGVIGGNNNIIAKVVLKPNEESDEEQ